MATIVLTSQKDSPERGSSATRFASGFSRLRFQLGQLLLDVSGVTVVRVDLERTFKPINLALLTVSDTRTAETDTSGDILAERIKAAGHHLSARAIERDEGSDSRVDLPRTVGVIPVTTRP